MNQGGKYENELASTAYREDAYDHCPKTRIIIDDEYHMQNIATVWAPTGPNSGALGNCIG
jgi:hypothetical protein